METSYQEARRDAERALTAEQAEAVVDDRIQTFGLGALPRVTVVEADDGTWLVRWTTHHAHFPAMTLRQWKVWLERHVGSLDPERLQTSEG